MVVVRIDVSGRHNCNVQGLNSPADSSASSDEDEDENKQYESAPRFADALSYWRDMPWCAYDIIY
jgi:hypothetical protein